ncbi:MAG: hypothetical protein ACR2QS_07005 [Woeseiaceae bacterium]
MSNNKSSISRIAKRELALFLGLLLFGLVLLPIGVFFVGDQVFGDYGPAGFTGFFNTLSGKIRSGEGVAWFLVLSPYLAWQSIRLTALAWRSLGNSQANGSQSRQPRT